MTAAFEHNHQPVERTRFYAIACDPRRSVAVEACAGAGKTWMLVSRMVRALLDGAAPHEILAITFTKKAAGEMRQRLQECLVQFSTQDDVQLGQELLQRGFTQEPTAAQLQTLRTLHQTLLASGRPVQIRTFHSWFAALLRSAPLQALTDLGLPTHYELLENDEQAIALVWPRFQTRVSAHAELRQDYLAAVAAHGRFQTQKALESALSKRVEFELADAQGVVDASVLPFGKQFPEFAGVEQPDALLRKPAIYAQLQEVARLLGAAKAANCVKAAVDLEQALAQHDLQAAQDALLTKAGAPRKLSEKMLGIEQVRQAQDCLLRIGAAQTQYEAWSHQQRMARLTRLLVVEYAQLKRERGWIDMGDLERSALALMSDPVLSGWVQERLDARVRHLMVDEFQDTNPLQWQALDAWLSGYVGAGSAPSVFLVGDPKQSIYRFRRAEPQVFKAAQRFVTQGLGGDLLSCDHTRRNAPGIIALVNQVMGQAQDAAEFDGFRPHSTESQRQGAIYRLPRIERDLQDQAAPAHSDTLADSAELSWRDSLTTPRQLAEETRKVQECRQAAQWLAQYLHSSGLAARDVMVLARKRERLGLMQAELTALHIAAQQPEKNELAEAPEVLDLIALLDVLVSPAHDLAMARALKSPVFGVNDDDLVQLVLCQRAQYAQAKAVDPDAAAPTWLQVLQTAPDLPPALASLGAVLTLWKAWVDRLPPHDALSAIYHHGDLLAHYGAATPATQRASVLANLRALLSAALQVDGGRYLTSYALVRALRAGGQRAPVRADVESVRLLTVHGAKGLEAPLVLLLDTDGESTKAQSMGVLVDWPGEDKQPKRFVFLANESKPPACVADVLATELTARQREELNDLYVALTRTQQTLVVSSLEPHHGSEGSWWVRLHDHAQDAPWVQTADALSAAMAEEPASFSLLSLPELTLDTAVQAHGPSDPGDMETSSGDDSLDSRVGQAMHNSIAQALALEPQHMEQAQAMARTILQGEGSWAWDTDQLAWQGNEVALVHRGRSLRLDRLVCTRGTPEAEGQWWVLDYKSTGQPQLQPELCEQLLTYRAAVARAQAGHTVRAAFLTAHGTLIELRPHDAPY